ncbi:hypothetical protein MNBD_PLANCTO03-550 [hydrothermal vent metagenome]|uniref:DUF7330 domain-containing protein n=1 Tax=hydrothermal vent metagenome TaxID=652676 RepID=A0A3B1DW30_9ZZZZ
MTRTQVLVVSLMVGVGAAGLCATGCGSVWQQARFEREIEVQFLLPPGSGVSVVATNGSITLAEAARDDVLVRAVVKAVSQERAEAVEIVGTANAGWLEVKAVWPEARKGNEGVSFVIDAPGGRMVRADTSNGAITITGFAGGAEADTSNGAVSIEGHEGPIVAETSNGKITVLGATERVEADTSNGTVRVELADEGSGPVLIDTSNGSVVLVVGPGFAGQIKTETSNGSIQVSDEAAGERVRLVTDEKKSKVVQVGEGETESVVDTSNGSVTITIHD